VVIESTPDLDANEQRRHALERAAIA
jgi:hypothetical protein